VEDDRLQSILSRIEAQGDAWRPPRLCQVSQEVVGASGAGIMLMGRELPLGSLCTTNAVSAAIEELQYTLGEGPCVDAYRQDQVVSEPNLADPVGARWLAFTPKALDAGARAIFAFPLRVGAARIGVLDFYQDRPGPLAEKQHADALALCSVVAHSVLDIQADAPPGTLAAELEVGTDFHFVVHNAAGAVSVQLGVSVTEAMIRLRAYAFSRERSLRDVAEDVVDRKLRLG